MKRRRRCPICGQEAGREEEQNRFFPFCSERCRMADLGKWLRGDYHIAGEKVKHRGEGQGEEEA